MALSSGHHFCTNSWVHEFEAGHWDWLYRPSFFFCGVPQCLQICSVTITVNWPPWLPSRWSLWHHPYLSHHSILCHKEVTKYWYNETISISNISHQCIIGSAYQSVETDIPTSGLWPLLPHPHWSFITIFPVDIRVYWRNQSGVGPANRPTNDSSVRLSVLQSLQVLKTYRTCLGIF
jgi:hypothetical protein